MGTRARLTRLALGSVGVLASATAVLLTAGPALAATHPAIRPGSHARVQPLAVHQSTTEHATSSRHRRLAAGFTQTNIVSDQKGKAALTDPNLINAWGMSRGPNSPIWVSNFGTNTSTLYTGANGTNPPSIVPLVVKIPGASPTGQTFNDTTAFDLPGTTDAAHFIFASVGGDITAWNSGTNAVVAQHVKGARYTGLALAHSPFGPLLLAANFIRGTVDVFDGTFTKLDVPLLFHDPALPKGYAPFNVAELGTLIYVTYGKVDPADGDDEPASGTGSWTSTPSTARW